MQRLAAFGYTRYVYAPKGDAALRRSWDTPHTDHWRESLQRFGLQCKQAGVEFGVGITPFALHQNLSQARLNTLVRQVQSLAAIGVERIAMLFDDMESGTGDLAGAQLDIMEAAMTAASGLRWSLCPSYYSDDRVLDRVFGERPNGYLETLGAALPRSVEVFWTGPEVCSRQISVPHLERMATVLRRKPTLWDNYPVNDGPRMSTQLHLRGFTGRDARIAEHLTAHMINPALQPWLTTIPALTLHDLYRQGDRYDYAQSFERAARDSVGESLATALREDLLAFQDAGRHRIADRIAEYRSKYEAFEHPAAREIVMWLDGAYAVSAEQVQTQ